MTGTSLPFGKRARIVLAFWSFEAVLALIIAFPVHAAIARAYGSHPEGDAVLFHPGSLESIELVFRFDLTSSAIPALVLVTMCIAAVLGHLPLAAALVWLTDKRATRAVWTRAAVAFPRMVVAFAVSLIARGLIAGIAIWTAFHVSNAIATSSGEVAAYAWALASLVPFAIIFVAFSVLTDCFYARIVHARGLVTPFSEALASFRKRKLASILGWLARNVASLLVLLLGATAARALGGNGGAALVLLFVVHQGVQIARIALRVSWLSYVVTMLRT